jgi:hypothetical protein
MSERSGRHDDGKDWASKECGHRARPRMCGAGIWLKDGRIIGDGVWMGTFTISIASEEEGSRRRSGMGNFISGSIDSVASKGSEEQAGTDVRDADGSGHCHRTDGVAFRRAVDGRKCGDTAGSWRKFTKGVQYDSGLDLQGSDPRST